MFTIGEFSRLGGVSARMLRHYDAIGLLRPTCVGENGYRRYDPGQLPTLKQIETLKGYGFALAEIAGLLRLPEGELSRRIHVRRLSACRVLNEMRRTIRRMEDDIIKMEGNAMELNKYHVVVMDAPEQLVFGIRRTIDVRQTRTV